MCMCSVARCNYSVSLVVGRNDLQHFRYKRGFSAGGASRRPKLEEMLECNGAGNPLPLLLDVQIPAFPAGICVSQRITASACSPPPMESAMQART